jgi:hypothetical protein
MDSIIKLALNFAVQAKKMNTKSIIGTLLVFFGMLLLGSLGFDQDDIDQAIENTGDVVELMQEPAEDV